MDRIIPLGLSEFDGLSDHSRSCVFWETERSVADGDKNCHDSFEKEAWTSSVLLEWGVCGQILIRDGRPVGTCLYAPPNYIPRDKLIPAGPTSADAMLLSHVYIEDDSRSMMSYVSLINAAIQDLKSRGVRAIEAYGRLGDVGAYAEDADPHHWSNHKCIPTQDVLSVCGFKEIIRDPRVSRWRMDIDRHNLWAVSVKAALERRHDQKIELLTYQRRVKATRCRSSQPPEAPQK
ncbi:MAG TPA: GNAT family N-acetyltransferase [Corynebacteriales bacterium]|nr:GNAT family N-acetyltransferase [Mycobacteriales bacterium]